MSVQRTYWHLAELGRKPSDYDIASSELLYHTRRGFEVSTDVSRWIERHQHGSPLQCADWEHFRDPRATTYASYVTLQRNQEIYVDGLLAAAETDAGAGLSAAWLRTLGQLLGSVRFPLHGLQMVAAYLGSIAPSGKIAIACAFQVGDEIRRIQRLTQHLVQLERVHPGLGREARSSWQHAPAWQPLRALIERLLVTYDFGEALVALCAVVKQALDALLTADLAELARSERDDTMHKLLGALARDCAWHAQWSGALLGLAVAEREENRGAVEGWLEAWRTATRDALLPQLMSGKLRVRDAEATASEAGA
jgi:toluene monooxygenase system protein E